MKYLVLAFLWAACCFLHSTLISLKVTGYVKQRFKEGFRFYRLVYNGFALVTLVPVALYAYGIQSQPLFSWHGPWRVLQVLLLAVSLFFFLAGAARYDLLTFLGLRQMKKRDECVGLTETCALDTRGVLGVVRHPWYAGGMIIIWARDLDPSAILTNLILTGYLVIGAFLEERRLSVEFPADYEEYRHNVSMLIPYQWLKSKWKA